MQSQVKDLDGVLSTLTVVRCGNSHNVTQGLLGCHHCYLQGSPSITAPEEHSLNTAKRPTPIVREGSAGKDAPTDVVLRFLNALVDGDIDTALSLIADDIVYENVSLPAIRGRKRLTKAARSFYQHGLSFQVVVHRTAENGSSVLTERTDALILGPFRTQFWVCGVFEVSDGKITFWRDYFDWSNIILAVLRGLIGAIAPSMRARFT